MYKKVDWNAELKDHKQYNWKFISGEEKFEPNQKLKFNVMLDIKSRELINDNERLIKYSINLDIGTNQGKILIDGDCILYSTDQKTIELLINGSLPFRNRIKYTIYKRALPIMEELSKENGIPFPPYELLLNYLSHRFQEEKKRFNEIASKMDIDKIKPNGINPI